MGRGVSAGGGKSSLNYLFGSGENSNSPPPTQNQGSDSKNVAPPKPEEPTKPVEAEPKPVETKQSPANVHDSKTNNYLRSEGQNCGNFITVWHYHELKHVSYFGICIHATQFHDT